ncbi:heat shock factor 2-binding protein [Bufo gargarizans]|uniref:heat shock factor 2-binding protein n=1 Tax=Bufo gargarizans TaxID=30331 RepID=UPI001CF1008F|nr:heat shock factor 2-binding protein [Bufo gargarizans]
MSGPLESEFLLIRRRDLERLTTEVMQMKEFLPKILNQDLLESVQRLEVAESALEERELDCEHIQARLQATQSECLRAKEENLSLLLQVTELREQNVQQVDFCSQMGSALCTLLWGVSNREETVRSILGMDVTAEFFSLAGQTVSRFVESFAVNQDEDTEESRFVLGLAGTITNVAAVSCGRSFLMSSCRDLMEKWILLLGEIRSGSHCQLRVLILMSLYNVSIHRDGLLWMSRYPGIMSQLQQLLTDPDNEVCLHTLRLIQSLVLEPDVLHMLWEEVQQCLPRVTELSHTANSELRKMASELLEELKGPMVEG